MQSFRTFRVFVSSTFSDLKEERNALQELVFPRLRELCEQRGCQFQAIDLRWGVSEEAALDQQTMRICLEEIDRCQRLSPRPNFIVLLGDRYGWQPLPYDIPATEYDALTRHLGKDEKTLVDTWYRLDENSVPTVYDFLPRDGKFEEFSAWEPVERELLTLLRTGFEKSGLPSDARLKYFSSATEQEIYKGALDEPGAGEHVFCFFRGITDLPQDNKAKEFIDLAGDGILDTEAHERLTKLKERLRNDLIGNVHEYNDCRWTGSGITTTHINQLCEDVYQDLSSIISEELSSLQQIDTFEQEIADHAAFAEERACHFTGRLNILEAIRDYVSSDSRAPLLLHGEGGSGKSALMAKAISKIAEARSSAVIISRFIGTTPNSSNIFSLLESLCRQIARQYGEDAILQTEYKELVEEFRKQLGLATKERPLILLLDALDQLSDAENARNLTWLPVGLPNHVKVILSVLNPSDCLSVLQRKIPETDHIALAPLSEMEGEELLDLWLADAGRTLKQAQKEQLLSRFRQCNLPLYLKLAFEEARKWESYGDGEISGSDIQGIILEFLGNLADEARHGEVLVKHALGYIAAGKNGLTEEEMLDLLSLDNEVKEAFWKRSPNSPRTDKFKLPVVIWSRLYLDLKPYLTERSADHTSVMSFFHRQFGEVVRDEFLDDETRKELHLGVADYFAKQPYYYQLRGDKVPHYRKVSEITFQMTQGEMWEELEQTLTDCNYSVAKCMADMVDELVVDYQKASTMAVPNKEAMSIWSTFFWQSAHVLRRGDDGWPSYKILLQLAIEHADDSPVTIEMEKFLEEGKCDWEWLRRERRSKNLRIDSCVAVFEGHTSDVEGALLVPDGRILSWSYDNTLRLWNSAGVPLEVLKGHTKSVYGALLHSDGRFLSWSSDNTLRLWTGDGVPLAVLEGHTESVKGALILSDGRFLSWSKDHTLRLWSGDGQPLTVLKGHSSVVKGTLFLTDGKILSWAENVKDEFFSNRIFLLWDINGEILVELEGHTNDVVGALLVPDGRILSWSYDNTLRLWNSDGAPLAVLEGHTNWVYGALLLPDGRFLSWSRDHTLRLWNTDGEPLVVLEGHQGYVSDAKILPDGRILSWSADNNLRLWNTDGAPLVVLEGHEDCVRDAQLLPDGRIISWAGDTTFRLWNSDGELLYIPAKHTFSTPDALILPTGRLLSWSDHKKMRLWNLDGVYSTLQEGHMGWVEDVLLLHDGRFLSWSDDCTLRLWNPDGEPLAVLEGHTGAVNSMLLLHDGRFLSWSDDCTLRLWNPDGEPLAVMERHTRSVDGALVLPDGRFLSWSADNTLRIWNSDGVPLTVVDGHTKWVKGALLLPDGRFLSWSRDHTLRLWSTEGEPIVVLEGHTESVYGALLLPDGRFLSWSADSTLRLWSNEGKCISVMGGHSKSVINALHLPDGRFLSWSSDDTLRLWSPEGIQLVVMEGTTWWAGGAQVLHDGRILSYSPNTTSLCLCLWSPDGALLEMYKRDGLFDAPMVIWQAYLGNRQTTANAGIYARDNTVILKYRTSSIIYWHGESECLAQHLFDDGRMVVTQENGQVCFSKTLPWSPPYYA